jgi:hypothetical protein
MVLHGHVPDRSTCLLLSQDHSLVTQGRGGMKGVEKTGIRKSGKKRRRKKMKLFVTESAI